MSPCYHVIIVFMYSSVWKRYGLVQGPPATLPHLLLPPSPRGVPVPQAGLGAFGRATSSRFLIVGPKALQTETAFRQRGTFVCSACGRSSAPAAPTLRHWPGRALRARPRGGRRAGRGIRDDAGCVFGSSRNNRQSGLSGIGITRI